MARVRIATRTGRARKPKPKPELPREIPGIFGHHEPGWSGSPWDLREAHLFADRRGITCATTEGLRALREFFGDDGEAFARLFEGGEHGEG